MELVKCAELQSTVLQMCGIKLYPIPFYHLTIETLSMDIGSGSPSPSASIIPDCANIDELLQGCVESHRQNGRCRPRTRTTLMTTLSMFSGC